MTLAELTERLQGYAEGTLAGDELRAWLDALLIADPLDVEASPVEPWDAAPEETRLFWRLVYLFEHDAGGCEEEQRRRAGRIVRCMHDTGCAATVSELLPLLEDQERLGAIVHKHLEGVISRTGVLSVIAESGYPPHVKLWLSHAGPQALLALTGAMSAGDYAAVRRMLDAAPGRE